MKTVIKLLKRVVTLAIVAGAGYFGWMYWQERQAAEEEQGWVRFLLKLQRYAISR